MNFQDIYFFLPCILATRKAAHLFLGSFVEYFFAVLGSAWIPLCCHYNFLLSRYFIQYSQSARNIVLVLKKKKKIKMDRMLLSFIKLVITNTILRISFIHSYPYVVYYNGLLCGVHDETGDGLFYMLWLPSLAWLVYGWIDRSMDDIMPYT